MIPDVKELFEWENRRERELDTLFEDLADPLCGAPPAWVVRGFIEQGDLVLLAGNPKEGKTCFATALALAVATGTPFAGMPTTQGGVLWLCLEESRRERKRLLLSSPLASPETPLFTCYEPLALDDPDALDAILRWKGRTEATLIVVDPLQAAVNRRLDRPEVARRVMTCFKQLTQFCAVLVLHHKKGPVAHDQRTRVAQSVQLEAASSMSLIMTTSEVRGEHPYRRIILRSRGRTQTPNTTWVFSSRGPLDYVYEEADEVESMDEGLTYSNAVGCAERILHVLEQVESSSAAELKERLNWSLGTIRNAIIRLKIEGKIRVVQTKLPRRYALNTQPGGDVNVNRES